MVVGGLSRIYRVSSRGSIYIYHIYQLVYTSEQTGCAHTLLRSDAVLSAAKAFSDTVTAACSHPLPATHSGLQAQKLLVRSLLELRLFADVNNSYFRTFFADPGRA